MIKFVKRISQDTLTRRFPRIPIAIAVALTLPSLWVGIQADDYFIRTVARSELPAGYGDLRPYETYTYFNGDPDRTHDLVDHGYMPWWTDPGCLISFGRPLTGLTQMLDFRVWPDYPALMHVQSLVWFVALVAVASILYRRMLGHAASTAPIWAAGLAALLFAVDDAHAVPASWLANRNATIAAVFGVAALIAHDLWRRDQWGFGVLAAPLLLFVGLCGKEEAISTCGYLFAYAVFLDRGPLMRRLATLTPYVVATVGWFVLYRALGYGVSASGGYLNPLESPLQFAGQAIDNAPLLLMSQWLLPPADVRNLEAPPLFAIHWWTAVAMIALIGVLMWPLLRRDRAVRFWCTGMLLATLPVSAIFPSDRLLLFVGLGAMGMLATWISVTIEGEWGFVKYRAWRRLAKGSLYAFLAIHLLLAPLMLAVQSVSMKFVGEYLAGIHDTLPAGQGIESQTFIFVSTFTAVADSAWILRRMASQEPLPDRTLSLNAASCAAEITRIDERTLSVRPVGGYLKPDDWTPSGAQPLLSSRYLGRHLDRIVRSADHPLRLGDTIELTTATITISELTRDHRPAEATFRFRKPLDDPSLRWLAVTFGGYREFEVPPIGQSAIVTSLYDPE